MRLTVNNDPLSASPFGFPNSKNGISQLFFPKHFPSSFPFRFPFSFLFGCVCKELFPPKYFPFSFPFGFPFRLHLGFFPTYSTKPVKFPKISWDFPKLGFPKGLVNVHRNFGYYHYYLC